MASLEEVKKIIYSLTIPHKNGIKLRYLLKEYVSVSGHRLCDSCEKFGFANEIDLLRDANHLIGITIINETQSYLDYMIYAIPDKQTKHIHELVCEQKTSDETRKALIVNPNINALRQRSQSKHRTANRSTKYKPYSLDINVQNDTELEDISNKINGLTIGAKTSSQRCAVCPLPNNRIITVNQRQKIAILMNKYFKGINLINFMVVYHHMFKETLDFNVYGFNNLEEFLSEMPEIIKLTRSSDNDVTVMPVKCHKQIVINQNSGIENNMSEPKNVSNVCDMSPLPANELDKFKCILKRNSKGIAVNNFIKEYEHKYGPMIVSKWGFGSPVEMFFHLRNVFYVEKLNNSEDSDHWILHEYDPELYESRKTTQKLKRTNTIDNEFKTNAIYIIKEMTEKVSKTPFLIEDFASAYDLVFNKKITATEYGFTSLKELFTELCKETDIIVREKIKNKPYLIYK